MSNSANRETEPAPAVTTAGSPPAPLVSRFRAAIPIAAGLVCVTLATQLPLGTPARPGPGMWPTLCGMALLVAGVAGMGVAPARDEEPFTARSVWVLLAAASLAAFIIAMPLVGFEAALLALLVVWLKVFGGESWRPTVLVSLSTLVVLHLLFIELLGLQIPRLV